MRDGLNFNNQRPAASLPTVYATSIYRAFSHHELISDFPSQHVHFPLQNLTQLCCFFHKRFEGLLNLCKMLMKMFNHYNLKSLLCSSSN